MPDPSTPAQRLIDLWPAPPIRTFADDIGEAYGTVKAMRRRGTIPVAYWLRVVAAAKRRKITGVTFRTLTELHAEPERAA